MRAKPCIGNVTGRWLRRIIKERFGAFDFEDPLFHMVVGLTYSLLKYMDGYNINPRGYEINRNNMSRYYDPNGH